MTAVGVRLSLAVAAMIIIVLGLAQPTPAVHNTGFFRRMIFKGYSSVQRLVSLEIAACSRPCPLHSCRLDESIQYGYCCGCSLPFDNIPPVACHHTMECPSTPFELCGDYNYVYYCCC